MVSPARFELAASKLGILRSIQLSYEDKKNYRDFIKTACERKLPGQISRFFA